MRHLSFDFWGTVGKSNPDYSRERTVFIAKLFNISPEEAKAKYNAVKASIVSLSEKTGMDYGHRHNLMKLADAFCYGDDGLSMGICQRLDAEFNRLFALHPPTVDDELVDQMINDRKRGCTLSIGSNTDFIRGETIRKVVLRHLPFAFMIFSDEVQCAKPNRVFFNLVAKRARQANGLIKENTDIIHIGDNHVTDVGGAEAAGMRSAFTPNADNTAKVVADLLEMI